MYLREGIVTRGKRVVTRGEGVATSGERVVTRGRVSSTMRTTSSCTIPEPLTGQD